jgi:hypothetical protein
VEWSDRAIYRGHYTSREVIMQTAFESSLERVWPSLGLGGKSKTNPPGGGSIRAMLQ